MINSARRARLRKIWRSPRESVRKFPERCDGQPGAPSRTAICGKGHRHDGPQGRRAEASCDQRNLVADKVKADSVRPRPIKKERGSRFENTLAQRVPRIGFAEDAFSKAFGTGAAVRLLEYLEHQFRHTSMIWRACAAKRTEVRREIPLERIGNHKSLVTADAALGRIRPKQPRYLLHLCYQTDSLPGSCGIAFCCNLASLLRSHTLHNFRVSIQLTWPVRCFTSLYMCSVPPGPSLPPPFHRQTNRVFSRPHASVV